MTMTMPDELRAPGWGFAARDQSARRLLQCVLDDANGWFYGVAGDCPACQAGRPGIDACPRHVADHERTRARNDLWLWLDHEDRPGQAPETLSARQLRVLADALPLAIDVRRARRDSTGATEDHALVAAYSEMARRS
jgi:hypothetical protein